MNFFNSRNFYLLSKYQKFFVTSARPFPSGGFPPKLQQGNVGYLSIVSRRKIKAPLSFLWHHSHPCASTNESAATKNAVNCNFSSRKFANVNFFS